mgnify:CR=1 FL=1
MCKEIYLVLTSLALTVLVVLFLVSEQYIISSLLSLLTIGRVFIYELNLEK